MFISTQNLFTLILIINITNNSGAIIINIIKLLYKTANNSINFIINNILYLLIASANLIFILKL